MMALVSATLLLLRTHFARVLFSRRMALCALIALGPAVVAALVLSAAEHAPLLTDLIAYLTWFLLLQIVVPVVALIAGAAVISEEIEDRTITYLFTRPFPRAALLLGRWVATACILAGLLGGSALLLVTVANVLGPTGAEPIPSDTITVPLILMAVAGGAVYSALFAVIGVFLKHPMIIGLAYSFVIEGALANVPGKSQGLSVLYHLRSYASSGAEAWSEIHANMNFQPEPQADSVTWLVTVMLVTLVLGSLVVSRKQYVLTA